MAKRHFTETGWFETLLVVITIATFFLALAWLVTLSSCASSAPSTEAPTTPVQPSGEWFCHLVGCGLKAPPHRPRPDASMMPATTAYALELQACMTLERTREAALRCRALVDCKWGQGPCPDASSDASSDGAPP